jgi:hypothetical protein
MTLGELGSSLGRTAARYQDDDKAESFVETPVANEAFRCRNISTVLCLSADFSGSVRMDRLEHC